MKTYDPQSLSMREMHGFLLSAIGPRPIALASTIDEKENPNLAPFSFFNVFSANPPLMIFSPARRGTDASTKHTYENVNKVKEVVINVVSFPLVRQMVLTSANYPAGVSEFEKAGFTPLKSELVQPPRIAESPVQFECKVHDVIALGHGPVSGNLVMAEVVKFHIREEILTDDGKIDPLLIDLVGRAGGNYYVRAQGESMFEISRPNDNNMGFDKIPEDIRKSKVLTGNDLAILANEPGFPDETAINEFKLLELHEVFIRFENDAAGLEQALHRRAHRLIGEGRVTEAWKTLLAFNN